MSGYVYEIAKRLVERGHKATVITRGSWGKLVQREIVNGIPVYRVFFAPCYPFHVHLHGIAVNRLLKRLESSFDIVHLHTPLPPPVRTTLPVVTTVHTPMRVDVRHNEMLDLSAIVMRLQTPISYSLERKILASSTSITAVASSVAKELEEYGVDSTSVEVIGVGVDHTLFRPPSDRDPNEKYIMYAGWLGHRKGLFDLIKCAEIVCRRSPTVKFFLIGEGPFKKKLQVEVARASLHDNVKFIPRISHQEPDKLIRFYQNATIYVQPSHYEGLPAVVLEAMACACPVVATAVSGHLDAISSRKNGVLVPAHSPIDMAEAMFELLDDETLRMSLGSAARQTIEERFTWDVVTGRILECYERIIPARHVSP